MSASENLRKKRSEAASARLDEVIVPPSSAANVFERRAELLRELQQIEARENAALRSGLAREVKHRRAAIGASQEEFATGLGIGRTMICNIELATALPSLEVLCRIASAFQVKPGVLLDAALESAS